MPRAPFAWMNDVSRRFLAADYAPGITGEERVRAIAETAAARLGRPEFADRFYDYVGRGWYSLSSPVWSNYGLARGLPISCFGTYVEDSMESILRAHVEVGMMSKFGGGTSLCMTPVRPRGAAITDNGKSAGTVHFAQLSDLEIRVISQGSSRRGECAVYWDIGHADVPEAIERIRNPRCPEGSALKKLSWGVTVRDAWMRELIAGKEENRARWAAVARSRRETGYPYIIFIDTANRCAPPEYAKLGLVIHQSNLCTEIFLANGPTESFVCCLSSMNMRYFDEWVGTDAVETLVYFLDTVISEFIERARGVYGFDRAVRFAENQRALGLGQLGWHDYLQSHMIPFDSREAASRAASTSRAIQAQARAASARMAAEYGEPPYLVGSGRRHMTLTAIAPTQSSSAILGQASESVECRAANIAVKDKQKVKYTDRNPFLMELLGRRGAATPAVLDSILGAAGSVQHLDCLTADEKLVFRTLREVSPMAAVTQAAARAPHVCQGQSLNLLIDPTADMRQVNKLMIAAWEGGVKSLYYQKNVSAAQDLVRDLTSCAACEG